MCVLTFQRNMLLASSGCQLLIQVIAEVVGKKGMIWLYGKVGEYLANQSNWTGWRIGLRNKPVGGGSNSSSFKSWQWGMCMVSLLVAQGGEMCRLAGVCGDLNMVCVLEWDFCLWRPPASSLERGWRVSEVYFRKSHLCGLCCWGAVWSLNTFTRYRNLKEDHRLISMFSHQSEFFWMFKCCMTFAMFYDVGKGTSLLSVVYSLI